MLSRIEFHKNGQLVDKMQIMVGLMVEGAYSENQWCDWAQLVDREISNHFSPSYSYSIGFDWFDL